MKGFIYRNFFSCPVYYLEIVFFSSFASSKLLNSMQEHHLQEINVYCDESRHTSDSLDRYMVIGAISCPRLHKREVVHRIHLLKKRFNAQGEFGWKRLSPNRKSFYIALIDEFSRDENLSFRCLVVDRRKLNHELYSGGDTELGFYKMYFQMLVHWLKPGCKYFVYLDWQQNKDQYRFAELRHVLEKKLTGRAKIACLEAVTSHKQPLIELTDLFIGAVGYDWNERDSSQTKLDFCQHLATSVQFQNLKISTSLSSQKFNIFHFQAK